MKTEPAKLRLYEAGLVQVVRTERAPVGTPPTDLDVVIAQLQDAGKRVGKGSEVALVVRSNVTRPWIRFERTGAMVAVSGAHFAMADTGTVLVAVNGEQVAVQEAAVVEEVVRDVTTERPFMAAAMFDVIHRRAPEGVARVAEIFLVRRVL